MKTIKILIIPILLLFSSCKAPAPLTEVIVRERLVPVQVPADSSLVQALLECDSNYKIVIKQLSITPGNTLATALQQHSDSIVVKTVSVPYPIYIRARDSIIEREVKVEVPVPVEVNKLSWWQKALIRVGALALVALILWLAWRLAIKKMSILSLITKFFKK